MIGATYIKLLTFLLMYTNVASQLEGMDVNFKLSRQWNTVLLSLDTHHITHLHPSESVVQIILLGLSIKLKIEDAITISASTCSSCGETPIKAPLDSLDRIGTTSKGSGSWRQNSSWCLQCDIQHKLSPLTIRLHFDPVELEVHVISCNYPLSKAWLKKCRNWSLPRKVVE